MLPKTLRDQIKALIADQIGIYVYGNGYTTEAISLGQVPNDIGVSGIEVIISITPTVKESLRADRYQHRREDWHITLVNHDGEQGKADLFQAWDKITLYYPRCTARYIPSFKVDELEAKESVQITILHTDGYIVPTIPTT